MGEELLLWLSSDNGLIVHLAVFVFLILGGLGFPFPEDVVIALSGVASAKGVVELHHVFATCYFGVMIADIFIFFIGYFFGSYLLNAGANSRFISFISLERIDEVREGLRKRRFFYIIVGRHLFPLRTITFVMAGALRLSFVEFVATDAIAALLSIWIALYVGFCVGERLTSDSLYALLSRAHVWILLLVLLISLLWALKSFWSPVCAFLSRLLSKMHSKIKGFFNPLNSG